MPDMSGLSEKEQKKAIRKWNKQIVKREKADRRKMKKQMKQSTNKEKTNLARVFGN